MATKPDTLSKILDGAISALAHQGPKKCSMSDICEEAGVARGTLYRYFKSKDEILEAVGDHTARQLNAAVQEAIESRPELELRIAVVMESMTGFFSNHPELVLLGKREPGFTLEYIVRALEGFRRVLHIALDPVLSKSPLVTSGVADEDRLIDLLLRVVFTYYYIPVTEQAERSVAWNILSTLAGQEVPHAPQAAAPSRKRGRALAS
jgi:AcrR family transcriptional regulator